MRYAKKIPGWHGGEPRGESGDVLGRSGECSNQNPQGGVLFLRESKRKGEWWRLGRVWEEEKELVDLSAHGLGPTCARHARTVRDTPADSSRGARTVWHPGADDPRHTGGQSAKCSRTVWPTTADSLIRLFNFSLIYSEIKIWICIFWDHCSSIMKETCHMMQCNYYVRKLCEKHAT
jgi:hypothetical protein